MAVKLCNSRWFARYFELHYCEHFLVSWKIGASSRELYQTEHTPYIYELKQFAKYDHRQRILIAMKNKRRPGIYQRILSIAKFMFILNWKKKKKRNEWYSVVHGKVGECNLSLSKKKNKNKNWQCNLQRNVPLYNTCTVHNVKNTSKCGGLKARVTYLRLAMGASAIRRKHIICCTLQKKKLKKKIISCILLSQNL